MTNAFYKCIWITLEIMENLKHSDITVGSYDYAEKCELVGLYKQKKIRQQLGDGFGLCRNDGLAVVKSTHDKQNY